MTFCNCSLAGTAACKTCFNNPYASFYRTTEYPGATGIGGSTPQNNDPWKHRSEGMRCKTCMWSVMKETDVKTALRVGRCRRHAPTMNGYPVVYENDWCGDHKVDENKRTS